MKGQDLMALTAEGRVEAARQIFVAAQVAEADPEFWEQYGSYIAGTASFADFADKMAFDVHTFFPKLADLRSRGLISSVEVSVAKAKEIANSEVSDAALFGYAQKVGLDCLPK